MPMDTRILSGHRLTFVLAFTFALAVARPTFARLPAENAAQRQATASPAAANPRVDPQAWFAKGQSALQAGDLDVAEAAFRKVLVADPGAGSAYANLGVIAMRRKDWDRAILLLRKAAKLEPKMAGIRLNMGLVEYRRGNYAAAVAPLSSVLRDQPDS